ncbi:hypothetical protein TorRG33x02_198150 [Trema orientale]|uniref:Transmembrane protein n=1 Tax=Trema orientale TaxID=63057 RepID=A0A2P5EFN1_TREOI|nr:hypothetical protein TorRG33x02_198150 [Trema orientale]
MLERIIIIILLKVLSSFMRFVGRLRFDMFWFRSIKKLFGGRLHVRVYTIQVVIIFFGLLFGGRICLLFCLVRIFIHVLSCGNPNPPLSKQIAKGLRGFSNSINPLQTIFCIRNLFSANVQGL